MSEIDTEYIIEQIQKLPRYSTWNGNSDNVDRQKVIEIIRENEEAD